jgi:hypothetical protein
MNSILFSVGGARRFSPPPIVAGEDHINNCFEHGRLFNTELLHRQMEKTAKTLCLAGSQWIVLSF